MVINEAPSFPLVLVLDMQAIPHRWISWQHACYYYAKKQVAWELGDTAFTVYGGHSKLTGERSSLSSASIIAVRGRAYGSRLFSQVPPLNNRELFHRDRHICAYCAEGLATQKLTRDHVIPYSRGGLDTWNNVVTACRACNQRKTNRTPEEAGMELIYTPYTTKSCRVSNSDQSSHCSRSNGVPYAALAFAKVACIPTIK